MALPTYIVNLLEDDELGGFKFSALVKNPAIQVDGYNGKFVAFAESQEIRFAVSDEDKHIISGPLLLADVPIYRNDSNGEYNIIVSSKSTPYILQKLFRDTLIKAVNIDHDPSKVVDGVYMFEAFLIDRKRMTPPVGYETLTDGSIFVSYKVDNEKVWSDIKAGNYEGFSFEGLLMPTEKTSLEDNILNQIKKILQS